MAVLVAAPTKRRTIVCTQLAVLVSGVVLLIAYSTILELVVANAQFPEQLVAGDLIMLNLALLCLHLFIAGICFFASCFFSETRHSIAFGAGIPALMYVIQMLANVGEETEFAKYFTFFTLFDANGIVEKSQGSLTGAVVLLVGAVLLYVAGGVAFCKKDLFL